MLLPDGHICIVDKEDEHHLYNPRFKDKWRLIEIYPGCVSVGAYRGEHRYLLKKLVLGLEVLDRNRVYHVNYDPTDCRKANLTVNKPQNIVKCPFTASELKDLYINRGLTFYKLRWLVKEKTGYMPKYEVMYRWIIQAGIVPKILITGNPFYNVPIHYGWKNADLYNKIVKELDEQRKRQSGDAVS